MVIFIRNFVDGDYEKYIKSLTEDNMKYFFETNFGGWSSDVSKKQFFKILNNGFVRLLFDDDVFCGYVSFIKERDDFSSFLINDFHIIEKFRRQGNGKYLLDDVISFAKNESVSQLKVFVFKNNPSINFYTRLGFVEFDFLKKSNSSVLIKKI